MISAHCLLAIAKPARRAAARGRSSSDATRAPVARAAVRISSGCPRVQRVGDERVEQDDAENQHLGGTARAAARGEAHQPQPDQRERDQTGERAPPVSPSDPSPNAVPDRGEWNAQVQRQRTHRGLVGEEASETAVRSGGDRPPRVTRVVAQVGHPERHDSDGDRRPRSRTADPPAGNDHVVCTSCSPPQSGPHRGVLNIRGEPPALTKRRGRPVGAPIHRKPGILTDYQVPPEAATRAAGASAVAAAAGHRPVRRYA